MTVSSLSQPRQPKVWILATFLVAAISALIWAIAPLQINEDVVLQTTDIGIVGYINDIPFTMQAFQEEVGMREAANVIQQQPDPSINKPELLNHMIQDILILQNADLYGVETDPLLVSSEVDGIIQRLGTTKEAFTIILNERGSTWEAFETSVGNYIRVVVFLQEYLLNGVPADQQQLFLQNWMDDQYQQATIEFDPAFLAEINP